MIVIRDSRIKVTIGNLHSLIGLRYPSLNKETCFLSGCSFGDLTAFLNGLCFDAKVIQLFLPVSLVTFLADR